jgi:hypothetical protein
MMDFYENISDKIRDEFMAKDFGKMSSIEVGEKIYSVQWDDIDGKTKAIIIKNYMDSAEKVLKKSKKKIQEFMEEETENYNEILGYNFKIKDIKMQGEDFFNYLMDQGHELDWGLDEDEEIYYDDFSEDLFENGAKEKASKVLLKEAKKMGVTIYDDLGYLMDSLR